jgi:hypothetical protein
MGRVRVLLITRFLLPTNNWILTLFQSSNVLCVACHLTDTQFVSICYALDTCMQCGNQFRDALINLDTPLVFGALWPASGTCQTLSQYYIVHTSALHKIEIFSVDGYDQIPHLQPQFCIVILHDSSALQGGMQELRATDQLLRLWTCTRPRNWLPWAYT